MPPASCDDEAHLRVFVGKSLEEIGEMGTMIGDGQLRWPSMGSSAESKLTANTDNVRTGEREDR
jgi:hypothetical protein